VHLGDRGAGERLVVDLGEHLVDRPAQLGGQNLLHLGPGRRGDLVPQLPQLLHELDRQQVGTG
jgi:hypothetical protein